MSHEDSRKRYLVYVIAIIAATGGLLFGFDTGVISGALLFIKKDWMLDPMLQSILVSSVLVGAIIGAACSGKVTDFLGRKNIIIITAIIFFIGSVGTAVAPNIEILIFGRIVIGFAIGCASFAVPLYISEISPPKIRGALVSMNQLAITLGIVLSYLVDASLAPFEHGWRYMFLVGIIPSFMLAIGMIFLPETPRWLMSQNREDEARKVFSKINGTANIDEEIQNMKKNFEEESGKKGFSEIFAPWIRPALIIGIGLMFFQQMTGINTVIYYAPTIFEMAGFKSALGAIFATLGIGAVNVFFTIVSIKLLDKVGRKPLLYVGFSGMVFSLVVLGIAFHFKEALGTSLILIALLSLGFYIASFALSLGPICWLIISEIYPLKVRGTAMSIATLSNWSFNFIIALTFLLLVQGIGEARTFWLYAVIGLLGLAFCYFYVPETKGYTLEEIEIHWKQGKRPRELI